MKIILVRHGETEANYNGIMQGQMLNYSLNDRGVRQAQALKNKLKDTKIDICFTSPLARAWQTAMILVGDRVEIKEDRRLIERYLGEYEGSRKESYDPKKYWDYFLNSTDGDVESIQTLILRSKDFLEEIYEKYKDSTVLVVSHSAIIRALHHLIKNTDFHKDLMNFKIENCYCKEYEFRMEKK